MNKIAFYTFLLVIGTSFTGHAQSAKPPHPGQILQNLKKLNVVGTALYVAAHPDDENTLMLTYLANERKVRTAYLALTRGDGGQNLIGTEQGVEIGLIRTQELLAARRIDGPEQAFSRAIDFGFSKSTDEAVRTWGQDKILADVVWMIRKYQPDVIITRFPPDARAGHGHHSASGYLAEEAFKISGDATKFPEQLAFVKPWKAKRIFWNVFIPNAFGSNKRPDEAGNMLSVETQLYNSLLGKSYGELAAESRTQHKSQGFGSAANRGERIDYLLQKNGDLAAQDPFDGVDLSWKRVPGSNRVQELVNQAIGTFKPENPAASVPTLVTLYRELQKIGTANPYVVLKKSEVEQLIQQCLGLWFEANPTDYAAAPGEGLRVNLSAVSRSSGVPVRWTHLKLPQVGKDTSLNLALKANDLQLVPVSVTIPKSQKITQPYWLAKPIQKGFFQVDDQQLIGLPENPPAETAEFTFEIDGEAFTFTRPWSHKVVDPVDGEVYRPFEIRPEVTANLAEKVYVFADNQPKTVEIILKANRTAVSGSMTLEVPAGWRVEPTSVPFSIQDKYQETRAMVKVYPAAAASEGTIRAVLKTSNGTFSTAIRTISYKHIPAQTYFPPAEARLVKLDVKVTAKQIGYIMGAGDEVPIALRQMGCTVTLLGPNDLAKDLSQYDAIVVGIRAYNTEEWLRNYQARLMDYVKEGGTAIVQYVTPGVRTPMGPYPFKIDRDRVTEEDAKMTFLNPQHPLLNTPNKITQNDFTGWVQERGLYFAVDWDKAYEPVFSANDTGEAPKQGSLIYAKYGKGHFMYTGLVFFRELPAGVPGAYRLFANMISIGKQ
ncbi:PIG-L family deacetylase [Tellurirhabdus bombi]|uniref:PIG-L family deacetylase n=1 Tax=Tellurirhabdus bombi TaxID=2907205 RepID=UPI001F3AA93A|nr:PIG-L family deacetylase [Tellurirhabdus bombi]